MGGIRCAVVALTLSCDLGALAWSYFNFYSFAAVSVEAGFEV